MPKHSDRKRGACALCGGQRGPDHQRSRFCGRCWQAAVRAANEEALHRNPRLAALDLFALD